WIQAPCSRGCLCVSWGCRTARGGRVSGEPLVPAPAPFKDCGPVPSPNPPRGDAMYWTVTMTDGRTETREGSEADATRWSSEPGVAHVVLVPDREVGDRGADRIDDRTPPAGC